MAISQSIRCSMKRVTRSARSPIRALTDDEIYGSVERFYRSFYFRPRYIFKSMRKMMSSGEECKRLLKEGMQFMSTMRERRNQMKQGAAA